MTLVTLEGGKLRFTPRGGNLYVGEGFNVIAAVLAGTYDRGSEPWPNLDDSGVSRTLAFTNTPETFVLRKSGGGEVWGRQPITFYAPNHRLEIW